MEQKKPSIHPSSFIDESAIIIGDVTIEKNCGIYPQAVVRGDENSIKIHEESNIQDCCILHVDESHSVSIGRHVSVGHGAIIHGATIKDACIIGMHATILNGAVIGKGSIIGAHALVTQDTNIPDHSLVLGIPGKVVKQDPVYQDHAMKNAQTYVHLSEQYKKGVFPRYQKKEK